MVRSLLTPAARTLLVLILFSASSCARFTYQSIDRRLAISAQRAVSRPIAPAPGEAGEELDGEPSTRSIFIGELIAIFPGFFVHGLGHSYAGDHETARKLRKMGEYGYLFTALGGGLGVGAYFLDRSQDNFIPLSLYIAAGGVSAVGLAYFFTAWIADIIDTPRAIRSGGQPWTFFKDEEDLSR